MNLDFETRELVKKEKFYTTKILKNLAMIDKHKLFSDYGFHSLYHYLIKGLGYSEGEAHVRTSAVKLINRSQHVLKVIETGALSLTNAAQVQMTLNHLSREVEITPRLIEEAVRISSGVSTRKAKENLQNTFTPQKPKQETLTLDGRILQKLARVRKLYGEDYSTYELLDLLLEEKLKTPMEPLRYRSYESKNSRYIPVSVKHKVNSEKCLKCGTRRNLEYDHILEFARGGTNSAKNIQVLCRNCNQRKELILRNQRFVDPFFSLAPSLFSLESKNPKAVRDKK